MRLRKPPDDPAIVYFVRNESKVLGVNLSIFDVLLDKARYKVSFLTKVGCAPCF